MQAASDPCLMALMLVGGIKPSIDDPRPGQHLYAEQSEPRERISEPDHFSTAGTTLIGQTLAEHSAGSIEETIAVVSTTHQIFRCRYREGSTSINRNPCIGEDAQNPATRTACQTAV